MTEAYKNLFVSTADSYQFSYISNKFIPNVLNITPTATYTSTQVDQARGILALQYLIKQYPSYNFVKKVVEEDYILIKDVLDYFGMNLSWYVTKWYNNEETRFIIRQAENKLRSFPLLSDVTDAGIPVDTYL